MKDLSVQAYSNQNQWACPSIQGLCGGILRADMYDEFAEWIVGATLKFKEQAGFDLYAVGLQNEPEFPEPYGSCVYTPAQLRDAAIRVGRRFKALNIPTKIFIGEILPQQNHVVDFFKAVNDNTEAKDYVSAFAIHDYEGDAYTPGDAGAARWTAYYQECQRVAPKKELWMTETSGQPSSMTGGMQVSSFLYNGLRFGNISAWNHFGLNKNQNQVWQCYKNFFKYIKPGAVRFDAVPSTAALLCLGFTNPRSGAVTFILINTSTVSHTVTISASGGSMPQSFDVYTTSSTKNCAANGTAVQSNNYSVTVEPTSVNTLYHIDPSPIRRPLGSADRQDHIAIMVRGNVISLTGRMDGNKGLAVLDMHGKLIRKCDVKSGPVFSLKVKGLAKGTYIAALGQDGILSTQAIFTVN